MTTHFQLKKKTLNKYMSMKVKKLFVVFYFTLKLCNHLPQYLCIYITLLQNCRHTALQMNQIQMKHFAHIYF